MVEVEETLLGTEEEPMPTLPLGRLGGEDECLPTTLIDRYEIKRRLGAGAMCVVYAARDIRDGARRWRHRRRLAEGGAAILERARIRR